MKPLTDEQREQYAQEIEEVARRLRAGEDRRAGSNLIDLGRSIIARVLDLPDVRRKEVR